MKTEGVRMDAYAKYKDAVSACGSMDYIDCNLSQVARKFGLKGPALANFMRVHFPQTLVWREEVRRWMGINDNTPEDYCRNTKTVCRCRQAVRNQRSEYFGDRRIVRGLIGRIRATPPLLPP